MRPVLEAKLVCHIADKDQAGISTRAHIDEFDMMLTCIGGELYCSVVEDKYVSRG